MSVKIPAPVTLPSDIKKVGVINRSTVSEETKKVDVVEKALTLEGKDLDKDAAKQSMTGLTDELMKNNRFTEVKALKALKLNTTGSGVFPSPLGWDMVDKICKENDVDALFALELFDTDTKISYTTNPITVKTPLGSVPGIEHHANMLTTVKTGWRIYDPKGKDILDEYNISDNISFTGKGVNPVTAAAALVGRKDAVNQVALKVGQEYAWRIIPYWRRVTRDYYVKGTNNFKIAKRKAQTGNWDEAGKLWEKETTNHKDKIAGRACYNTAIINEINGDLDKAIEWARKAYENYNNKLALNYIRILENRKVNENVLKQQDAQ
jgi:hypothetical protein